MKTQQKINKNSYFARINIAKKAVKISEDHYRLMLSSVTGKDSLKRMSVSELNKVIEHFKKNLGWKNNSRKKSSGKFKIASNPETRLIFVLWEKLFNLGALSCSKMGKRAALNSFCNKQTGIEDANWVKANDARKMIEILKKWIKRIEAEKASCPK